MTDESKTQTDSKPAAEDKRLFDPALDIQANLAEAGGSVSGRLYAADKDGKLIADIQLTARGLTAREAIDNFMDGVLYGKKYRLTLQEPLPPQAPAPIPPLQGLYQPPQTPTSPATGNPPMIAPPAPLNPPQSPTAATNQGGTIHAVKVDVEIRQDGRANLSFYMTGHKFADLSTVRSIEDAIALLAPCGGFTPAHIVQGASYTINALIDWQPGKLNSKGKPYKDIVAIRPA